MFCKGPYGRNILDRLIPSPIFLFSCYMKQKIKDFMDVLVSVSSLKVSELIGRIWWSLRLLQCYLSTSRYLCGQALQAASSVHCFCPLSYFGTARQLLPQGRKKTWSAVILNLLLVKENPLKKHYKKLHPVRRQEGSVHSKHRCSLVIILLKLFC